MLVILDRDGVINEDSPDYIKKPEEWLPIPGSLEAIARLKNAGFKVVIATNQSGIGRGLYTEKTLNLIHNHMSQALQQLGTDVDGFFYCPHHPDARCICRKPEPGLFLAIGKQFNIDLTNTISIGDSLRDIQAALRVGSKPSLVLTGNGRKTIKEMGNLNIPIYENLDEAVIAILQ